MGTGHPGTYRTTRGAKDIDIVLGLLAVLALILANGFYVAGEFALVAVDRTRIEQAADAGDRRAQSVLRSLRNLSYELSGAQLGITVTSLLVGFIVEPTVGRALEPLVGLLGLSERAASGVSISAALILATSLQMVLGELIPKNLAIARPQPMAYAVTGALRLSNLVFKPLIVFLNASANLTVRLLGITPREELVGVRSLEELGLLIESSGEAGTLAEEEYALLSRSVSFGEKTAADALTPRVDVRYVHAEATLADLCREALASGHSRLLVVEGDLDHVLGVAHVKDCYRFPVEQRDRIKVTEIVSDAFVVPESRRLDELLADMRRARVQLAVVVDEYGGTAGLITLEDLLEEIVGDIEDEHDPSVIPPLRAASPAGVAVLAGSLHRDDVAEACGLELPEGDWDTLAGFLLHLFGRIPEQGDHVSYEGWEFKVTKMDRRRIAEVLAVAPPAGRGEKEGR